MNNFTKKLILLTLATVVLNVNLSYAQSGDFIAPLDIPLLLSGNFCELRTGHFHAGIDIKTKSVIGEPVYAVYDGYVSRIKVSPFGYGRAIYIQHTNGYTTVYGHLNNYSDTIAQIVKKLQYDKHNYRVDKYFSTKEIEVKEGDLIGYTGNSGSSGGPHLHFEIRKTEGQIPQNVLKYNFKVVDSIAPRFMNLFVYYIDNSSSLKVIHKELVGVYNINEKSYKAIRSVVVNHEAFAFGVEVYDFLNWTNNKCGVYSIEMLQNGIKKYAFQLNEMSFGKTRYINSHMDYSEKTNRGRNVHKLFREPNNKLPIYEPLGDGVLNFGDTNVCTMQINASDVYGNTSTLTFKVQKGDKELMMHQFEPGRAFKWNEANHISEGMFQFDLAKGSLYSDAFIAYIRYPQADSSALSFRYKVGSSDIPLHKEAVISIKPGKVLPQKYFEKLVLINEVKDKIRAINSEYKNGSVVGETRNFGIYSIAIDTVAPKIAPIYFKNKGQYYPDSRISFRVGDNLSGIKTINAYIDSAWSLFEYDAKNNRIDYYLDAGRVEKGNMHTLKIYVIDEKSNIGVYDGQFYY